MLGSMLRGMDGWMVSEWKMDLWMMGVMGGTGWRNGWVVGRLWMVNWMRGGREDGESIDRGWVDLPRG